jgi:hypothetical protein
VYSAYQAANWPSAETPIRPIRVSGTHNVPDAEPS